MIRPAIISVLFLSPVAFATGDFVLPQSVQSSSPAAYDVFGSDIAMHAGSLMFVGVRGADAQGANAGAVEIFQRSAGAWSFLERPIATGLAAGDQLGESVAGNASWIIAGASRHDASGADAGAAWVFKKGASNWAFAQKLVPSAGSAGAHFGASVALSTNAMAVGAPTAASGGAVMTFRIVSNAWAPFTTIANPSPMSGDRFGDALAMTDSWLAIGDPFDDTRGTDAGAVHIYVKTPLNWGYSTTLLPVSTAAGQHFGQSVSISGTRLAVGAYGADTGAYESGRADVFDLLSSVWTRTASLTPSYAAFSGNFGWDVSLDSGTLAVGVPGGGAVALAGEVELFTRQSDATWLPVAIGGLAGAEAQDVLGASVATSAGQLVAAAPAAHPSNGYRGRLGAVDLSVDCDGNTIPDIFDLANGAPDCDGDGVQDACEVNSDGDALPNDCDGCPNDPNKTSAGACGCGVADTDSDSDGTPNCNDLCPNDPAKTSPGTCGCGVADTDSDGDGVANCNDGCPTDPAKTSPGTCGCGVADTDSDSDGVANCNDGCPNDPAKLAPGACGCGVADTDSDGDGTPNCNDLCPNDPNKLAPGTCGCGVADTDSDSDGTPNCNDGCPTDPAKLSPGTCGCGVADTDSDSDGVANCNDGCPNDPNKTSAGTCGCGVADTDSDGDGVANCNDGCPNDPAKTSPGTCGCGVADTDSDSDGTPNCNDLCPSDPAKTSPGTCGCGVADTDSDSDGTPNCVDTCPNDPTNQCDLVFEVPTEYATIQAAIDAAPADRASVVLVAAGTFNEGFDLRSKDIVVRGQLNGLTILRGVGLTTSIAKFSGGEPATAGVENLVFRDGTVGSRITPTTAYTVGGAIYGTNSFAFIRHCRFEGCRADYGGAVYLLYGGVTIDGCEFVGNIANIEGGGVQCFSCTGMVRGSVFNLNRCGMNGPGSGSALKFVGANATGDAIFVDDCSFTGNIAGVSGSAIEFYENVQGYPGVLHISRTNCANNVSGSPAQTGAAGLRVLGRMESCILSEGSIFCANLPRNVSGPYFDDGTAGVCDCAADFNADGNVNASDLSLLLSVWGATLASGVGDVTHNGTVDAGDLSILLSLWGACNSH